jgi:hypothetical protein
MLKTIKITFVSIAAIVSAYAAYTGVKGGLERSTDFKRLDAIAGLICVSSGIGAASATVLIEFVFKSQEKKRVDTLIQDLTKAMECVTPSTSAKLLDVVELLANEDFAINERNPRIKTR